MALNGNSTSTKDLTPGLQRGLKLLIAAANQLGGTIKVTSTRRSRAQQAALYANYIAGKSQYPALPPGQSMHEKGRAVDIVTNPYDLLYVLGPAWVAAGGGWDKSDAIHFQL